MEDILQYLINGNKEEDILPDITADTIPQPILADFIMKARQEGLEDGLYSITTNAGVKFIISYTSQKTGK